MNEPAIPEEDINAFLSDQVNEKIEVMEAVMLEQPQVDIPVEHRFVNGMYVREIVIPAGTLLTGRVHKFGYVDIMLSGDITVATPDGLKRLQGLNIMEGVPGRKRAGYAHEDTHWLTVHRTDCTDEDKILDQLTFFSMGEYRNFRVTSDRDSYADTIKVLGMTEAQVQEQVTNEDDRVAMPQEYAQWLELGQSIIHGQGIFALREFETGDHVGPARISGGRTELGRYSNHSINPNAAMVVLDNGDMAVVALRLIRRGEEITTNYAHTIEAQRGVLCQQ